MAPEPERLRPERTSSPAALPPLFLPALPAPRSDVAPELERLKVKAVARCRDLLLERVYDMRRPKTNLQARVRGWPCVPAAAAVA